jgi:hypothetical protein
VCTCATGHQAQLIEFIGLCRIVIDMLHRVVLPLLLLLASTATYFARVRHTNGGESNRESTSEVGTAAQTLLMEPSHGKRNLVQCTHLAPSTRSRCCFHLCLVLPCLSSLRNLPRPLAMPSILNGPLTHGPSAYSPYELARPRSQPATTTATTHAQQPLPTNEVHDELTRSPVSARQAYVTYATNSQYARGSVVMFDALRRLNSTKEMFLVHTASALTPSIVGSLKMLNVTLSLAPQDSPRHWANGYYRDCMVKVRVKAPL